MTTSGSANEPSDRGDTITTAAEKKQVEERVAVGINVVHELSVEKGKSNCSVQLPRWRGPLLRRDCRRVFPFSLKHC